MGQVNLITHVQPKATHIINGREGYHRSPLISRVIRANYLSVLKLYNRAINQPMMFLPEDKWSPRYDKQFYTIRMKKYITLYIPPSQSENNTNTTFGDDATCSIFGFGFCNNKKQKYPAIYYEIEVLSGTAHHTCLRRYSEFHTLCKRLDPNGDMGLLKILPPKTGPFHKVSDEFVQERMEGLYAFLRGTLIRQECVNNPLIEQFLELA